MKEAAGEANMTVITIVLIAIVAAVATPLISSLMNNSAKKACCTGAGYQWSGNTCKNGTATVGESTYWDSSKKECK